jgi:Flp pilus assembly pilin Flp
LTRRKTWGTLVLCRTSGQTREERLKPRTLGALVQDERGALMTEYIVVTVFIALGSSAAILYCAYVLAENFAAVRDYLLFPFP